MTIRTKFYRLVSFIMFWFLIVLILPTPADSAIYTNTKNFNSAEGLSWNYVWQQCLPDLPPGAIIDSAQIEVRAQVWSWGNSPYEQDVLASDTNSFNFSEGYVYTLNSATNPSPSNFYTTSQSLSASQLQWIQNDGCINFDMVTYGGTYYLDYAKLSVQTIEGNVVDHFVWDTIASPRTVNQSFPVTITAKDVANNTVADFSGSVDLSGWAQSGQATIFFDDFEDGNFGGWTSGSGSYTRQVTDQTASSGTYSLTLTGGSSTHFNGVSHTLANLTPDRIDFSVRSSSATSSDGYFAVGNGTDFSNMAVFFYMKSDGMMGLYDGTSSHMRSYLENQWYKISFVFDWTAKEVDYYVDDSLVEKDIPFRGVGVENLTVLYLYNFNNSQAWWDQIEFTEQNSLTPVSISPNIATNFVSGVWTGDITVLEEATNMILRADDGSNHSGDSNTFATQVTPNKVATPAFSPQPGSYPGPREITISCQTPETSITYTTDGSEPVESSTAYTGPIAVTETTTIKVRAFKDGWIPSDIATGTYTIESVKETKLYLRDNNMLSEEMGAPIPWIKNYIYPQTLTTIEWQKTLGGDISGSFFYSLDIVECQSEATIKIEFIINHNGTLTTAATKTVNLDILPDGYYQPYSGSLNGLDLQTQDGDILIFRISHESGTNRIAIALDGVEDYNDSYVRIYNTGPIPCFNVSPEKGDFSTMFGFDASCSSDYNFPTSQLQVRWDWDNDGVFDTEYTTEKTASRQFSTPGIKSVRLEVKNPEGNTSSIIKEVEIDLAILDIKQLPAGASAGLTWDGSSLWLSDTNNDLIYKITQDGQVINSFASPCGDPLDLAWDGTYLWIIDAWGSDGKGNVLYKVDTTGTVVTSFNLPADISTGLAWDGSFLWAADSTNGRIVKINPANGEVVSSFDSPGPNPRGLAWDGQYLWNVDWSNQVIYKINSEGVIVSSFPSPGTGPMGLAWDGSYLWCVDLDNNSLYKLTDAPSASPGHLSVTPTTEFLSSGFVGDTFNPSGITYTITNYGNFPIEWTLSKQQAWLDLSMEGGTLSPGNSEYVTASINATASSLAVGSYTDALIFVNVTEENKLISRNVKLAVNSPEGALVVTPDSGFTALGLSGGTFYPQGTTYTLKNVGNTPINWQASKSDKAFWVNLSSEGGSLSAGETVEVILSLDNDVVKGLPKNTYEGTVSFANITNGNGNTDRIVKLGVDLTPSTITCEPSRGSLILGEKLHVSGKISPDPSAAGAWVEVVLTSPSGNEKSMSFTANSNGEFSQEIDCKEINEAGEWLIRTRWDGDTLLNGAISSELGKEIDIKKARTRVTLDIVMSEAIKINNTPPIGGKFSPETECDSMDLSGNAIALHIIEPDGITEHTRTAYTNEKGQYLLDYQQAPDFRFDHIGNWTIAAEFVDNGVFEGAVTEPVTVRVVPTSGYAILVQGRIDSGEGMPSHHKTTSFVYEKLKERQVLDDDIKYLSWMNGDGWDGEPTRTNIQQAITEWARDKMITNAGDLYIIMVDHGWTDPQDNEEGIFYIYPDNPINSTELAGWLNDLRADLINAGTSASDLNIVVILGFCRAGAFIDDLSDPSYPNRIIVTSTAKNEASHRGPQDVDDQGQPLRDGEYFISEFFKNVSYGKSIKECFENATKLTEAFTSSGTERVNAPFFDDAVQHPLLDDNGDNIGSNLLSDIDGEDGFKSQSIFIGTSPPTGNDPGDVKVTEVAEAQILGVQDTSVNLWAKVDDPLDLRMIWAEVKAPNYDPPDPGSGEQIEMNTFKKATTTFVNGRYEWVIPEGGTNAPVDLFATPGTYQVFYFAKDDFSGNVSPLTESRVYKAKSGNNAPYPFSLVSPADGFQELTTILLDWENTTDPEGHRFTYTVLLSPDDPSFSNPIRKEGLKYSACQVNPYDGIENSKAYYWKVQAIDEYGAVTETAARKFYTNNTNAGGIARIKGYVFDAVSGQSIPDAVVNVAGLWEFPAGEGQYLGVIDAGTHLISASAVGYNSKIYSNVYFGPENIVTKSFGLDPIPGYVAKGNINNDQAIDLMDAILALQVLAGIEPPSPVFNQADANGDGHIGLEEVVYILQGVSGLRE